jgi:heterodisulfide reductase subunit A-like polyferredoxin
MGTLQSAAGGHRAQLYMEPGCKRCRVCEKACPMDLKIVDNTRPDGRVNLRDCLKCPECQSACPKGLLHFGEGTGARPAEEDPSEKREAPAETT